MVGCGVCTRLHATAHHREPNRRLTVEEALASWQPDGGGERLEEGDEVVAYVVHMDGINRIKQLGVMMMKMARVPIDVR